MTSPYTIITCLNLNNQTLPTTLPRHSLSSTRKEAGDDPQAAPHSAGERRGGSFARELRRQWHTVSARKRAGKRGAQRAPLLHAHTTVSPASNWRAARPEVSFCFISNSFSASSILFTAWV